MPPRRNPPWPARRRAGSGAPAAIRAAAAPRPRPLRATARRRVWKAFSASSCRPCRNSSTGSSKCCRGWAPAQRRPWRHRSPRRHRSAQRRRNPLRLPPPRRPPMGRSRRASPSSCRSEIGRFGHLRRAAQAHRCAGRTLHEEDRGFPQLHAGPPRDAGRSARRRGIPQRMEGHGLPIVVAKAGGSKLLDIDGNEYIDLVNGFGQTALGHSPPFVVEASRVSSTAASRSAAGGSRRQGG